MKSFRIKCSILILDDNKDKNSNLRSETPVKYLDQDKDDTSRIIGTILKESQGKKTVDTIKSKKEIGLLIDLIKVSDKEGDILPH